MASIGHVALGLAASKLVDCFAASPQRRWGMAITFAALSMLPDIDVGGFAFGIEYGDPWGHRGATHSLLFACCIGFICLLWRRRIGLSGSSTFAIFAAVVASHGVLDTLTDGGLGCALFWPLSQARVFAPWRPIPVAPIGLGFLSARGLRVSLIELLYFAPILAYGLWPLRQRPRVAPEHEQLSGRDGAEPR